MEIVCEELQQHLGYYVYEPLPKEVEIHIQSCSICKNIFCEMKETSRYITATLATDMLEETRFKLELKEKIRAQGQKKIRYYFIAAAVLMFAIYIGMQKKHNAPKKIFTTVESLDWFSVEGLEILKHGCER